MATLYVISGRSRLEKEHQRLVITRDDKVVFRVPIIKVSQVVLIGWAGATTPVIQTLLNRQVPLTFVSRSGKLLGRLVPAASKNLPLRQAQYRRDADEEFTLKFARSIVAGKLRNQRAYVLRLLRTHPQIHPSNAVEKLTNAIHKAEAAQDAKILFGIEGSAAKAYYYIYRQAFDEKWRFTNRNRRPPKDPVNALLSLGYTFLGYAMMAALEIVGLDPYLGYYHTEKYGTPALAMDLIEEFRTPIVDSLVLNLLNRRMLIKESFTIDTNGVFLTDEAMRIFLWQFSKKIETPIKTYEIKRRISYRKIFEVQARKLIYFINDENKIYKSYKMRS